MAATRAARTGGHRVAAVRVLTPLLVGLAVLGVWQFLVSAVGISDYLLPSPAAIGDQFVEFAPAIWSASVITAQNAAIGLLVGTVLAVLLAALAAASRRVDALTAPVVAALAVIPVVATAPVLNTMFGADTQFSRQVIAGLASFVPVFINTLRGLRQTRPVHRDLMRAYSASSAQVFRTVTLPTALPYTFTGVRVASSLAVIYALVAEYFGGPRGGLGSLISTSAASSAYPRAWAYVVASIIVGLGFYLATLALEQTTRRRTGAG